MVNKYQNFINELNSSINNNNRKIQDILSSSTKLLIDIKNFSEEVRKNEYNFKFQLRDVTDNKVNSLRKEIVDALGDRSLLNSKDIPNFNTIYLRFLLELLIKNKTQLIAQNRKYNYFSIGNLSNSFSCIAVKK